MGKHVATLENRLAEFKAKNAGKLPDTSGSQSAGDGSQPRTTSKTSRVTCRRCAASECS